MSDILNLNQLRYFYEVARMKNMKRAAVRMGVSQPALSKQVNALEEFLGLQLFYRSSRGMDPTPAGQVAFEHCEKVFGHIRELEEALDDLRSGSAGRLAIAAVNSIGVHVLPDFLRAFQEVHPEVRLRLVTSRSADVIQALREHRVDIGLIAGQTDEENMNSEVFLPSPLRVVVPPDHPLVEEAGGAGAPLDAAKLEAYPMVAFDEHAPTRVLTDRALEELEVSPSVIAESPDIEVLKRLVESGVGFGLLPTHSIRRELEAGQLATLDVPDLHLSRDLCIVTRTGITLTPAAEAFLELLRGAD